MNLEDALTLKMHKMCTPRADFDREDKPILPIFRYVQAQTDSRRFHNPNLA